MVVLLLTVEQIEQCTTAAIQSNNIVSKGFNFNSFIIETSQDKRCTSPTPNVTTNTPYIQILQCGEYNRLLYSLQKANWLLSTLAVKVYR